METRSPEPPNDDAARWAARYAHTNGSSASLARDTITRMVVLGYITAVAMPPVGFVIGLVLAIRLTKPDSRRGLWIIALSIVAAIAWVVTLATGLVNPNSNTST
jgi:hypothetical protein